MFQIQKNLEKETLKWLNKIKPEIKKIKKVKDPDFLANIHAYIKDTEYFLKKGDLINAFEAIIWSWSWLEIGKQKKILR